MPSMFSNKTGVGCMMLFCAPFALVGAFMLFLLAQQVTDSMAMSNWDERPATVIQAGGSNRRTTVEFRYDYQGTAYQSTKLRRRDNSSDNIGPFHKDWRKRLLRHQQNGDSLPCYVNPAKPTEAVLYRGIRWEMFAFKSVFVVVFGGFGFLLPLAGLRQSKKTAYKIESAGLAGEWATAEPMWENPAPAKLGLHPAAPLLFAVMFGAVSLPLAVSGWASKHFELILIAVPFLLVSIIAWFLVARSLRQRRRFGASTLDVRTRPGLPGSLFEADLHLSELPPDTPLRISLENREETGGENGTKRVLWRSMRQFVETDLKRRGAGVVVPLGFALPERARTSTVRAGVGIHWELMVQAKLPGPDLDLRFPVPVYPPDPPHTGTAVLPPEFLPGRHLLTTGETVDDLTDALAAQGIDHQALPDGGFAVSVPPRHRVSVHLGGFIFYILMLIGGIFLVYKGFRFGHVLGALGTVAMFWGLSGFFRSYHIEAHPDGLLLHQPVLGFGQERWYPWTEVRRVRSKLSMKIGETQLYDLVLYTPAKSKILRWLEGKEVAATLAKELEQMREAGSG